MKRSKYILNPAGYIKHGGEQVLSNEVIAQAIKLTNKTLKQLDKVNKKLEYDIFERLGMRNLSGQVGECFVKCLMKLSDGKLHSNLHQDGYPDLLLIDTPEKKEYFDSLYTVINGKKYPKDKKSFSPFKYGGIEVKATCGSTPPASKVPKPLIGEQRVQLMNNFYWAAHHRETNNLLGLLWDFIDGVPAIIAAFYQDNLIKEDWGKVSKPKEDGGRTTNSSSMQTSGIKKMCQNWIAVLDDNQYVEKLAGKKWIGYNVKSANK